MVAAPVFKVIGLNFLDQTAAHVSGDKAGRRRTERGCGTHPFDDIVTIGAAGARVQSRGAGGCCGGRCLELAL